MGHKQHKKKRSMKWAYVERRKKAAQLKALNHNAVNIVKNAAPSTAPNEDTVMMTPPVQLSCLKTSNAKVNDDFTTGVMRAKNTLLDVSAESNSSEIHLQRELLSLDEKTIADCAEVNISSITVDGAHACTVDDKSIGNGCAAEVVVEGPELHNSDKATADSQNVVITPAGSIFQVNLDNLDRIVRVNYMHAVEGMIEQGETSRSSEPMIRLNRESHDVGGNVTGGSEVAANPAESSDFMRDLRHGQSNEHDTSTILDVYGGYEIEQDFRTGFDILNNEYDKYTEKLCESTSGISDIAGCIKLPAITDIHPPLARCREQESCEHLEDSIYHECSDSDNRSYTDIISSDLGETETITVDTRRIVDLNFWWQQLKEKIGDHPCSFDHLKLTKKLDVGLRTLFNINCERCDYNTTIWTDRNDDKMLGINQSAVCGTLTSGIGCATMQEVLAAMGLPSMTQATYRKHRNRFYEDIKKSIDQSMKEAAAEEAAIAIQKGHVIGGDIPYIKVVVDGAWAKRSYAGGKHDSLSGVACIIGNETGKILFVGVRNKFCAFEARALQLGKEPREHVCFKNWGRDQSSTGMEKDIIVEGFMSSIEMHGIIYKTVIADGDASTHQAIRDANPYGAYGVLVEKIECNNHLFRNLCKKIKAAAGLSIPRVLHASLTMTVVPFRARIEKSGLQIRLLVECARDHRCEEDVSNDEQRRRLVEDIFVILQHVFGEHSACKTLPFACECKADDQNLLDDLRKTGIYSAVYEAVSYLSRYADSLLHKVTNNMAESFNSIVNKCNAGKRTNQCATNSYEIRCYIAAIQHNTQSSLSKVYEGFGKIVPDSVIVLESSRQDQVNRNKILRQEKGVYRRRTTGVTDKNYGSTSQEADLPLAAYQTLVEKHFEKLRTYQNDRVQIECKTRSQNDSELWHTLRLDIITASRFGEICRMQKTTSCARIVGDIRYPKVLNAEPVRFGIENEPIAKEALEKELEVRIEPCGLFIDPEIPYLGASPDGLIEPDGIVEVKCPFSARDMPVEEAIALRPNLKSIFDKKVKDDMNKSHKYFYQVQGQLHITQRSYCIFALWTSVDIKYVKVLRDDEFWHSRMEPLLCRFYMECLLPEIVDSRRKRSMPIKDPQYILQAKEEANRRKVQNTSVKRKQPDEEVCQKSTRKRSKSVEKEDSTSMISENQQQVVQSANDILVETNPNSNWVVIDSDDDINIDVPAMIDTIDVIRRNVTVDEVIADVLPLRNLLNDSTIDFFLEIVRENSTFDDFNAACYTGYYQCIKPCTVSKPDLQIMGGNKFRHWCCVFYDGSRIKIYDSLGRVEYEALHREEKRYLEKRYGNVMENHFLNVDIPQVTKQPDGCSCGVYAAAFVTTLALAALPEEIQYSRNPNEMRAHLVKVIESRKLLPFPTVPSYH